MAGVKRVLKDFFLGLSLLLLGGIVLSILGIILLLLALIFAAFVPVALVILGIGCLLFLIYLVGLLYRKMRKG